MKKTYGRKLRLQSETLRYLSPEHLRDIAGGVSGRPTCILSDTCGCRSRQIGTICDGSEFGGCDSLDC